MFSLRTILLKFMKICSKTHQIASFKKLFSGKHAPDPPSKRLATPRVASRFAACNNYSPSPQKVTPLANPAYAHGLLLRNLFEEMRS